MTDSHTDICEQRKVPRGQQMAATREVRCLTWTAKMTEGFGRDKYKEDRDTHLTTEPQGLSVRVYVLSCFSRVWLFATLWTVACQAPLSTGTLQARIYWSGLPCPPPEDLPDPGTEPASLLSLALAGGFFTTNSTWEAPGLSVLMTKLFSLYLNKWYHVDSIVSVPPTAIARKGHGLIRV